MKIDSMKEVFLSRAKEMYLFDCRVAGVDSPTMTTCSAVLASFIRFTGNILVKQLTPDHVRLYIANLSDGPSEGEEHLHSVLTDYAVIHDWIRWMYAQKFLTERTNSYAKPPRLLTRRFFVREDIQTLEYCEAIFGWTSGKKKEPSASRALFTSKPRWHLI